MDMQVLVRWMVGKLLKEDRLLGGGETDENRHRRPKRLYRQGRNHS